jgi:hypothetical protein
MKEVAIRYGAAYLEGELSSFHDVPRLAVCRREGREEEARGVRGA